MLDRSLIRQDMRRQRSNLSQQQQKVAAQAASTRLFQLPWFRQCLRLGIYHPCRGELPTDAIAAKARHRGKEIYYPVLKAGGQVGLRFANADQARWRNNRYGIPEPCGRLVASPRFLDLVIVPLVAFDRRGNRLGMGGGYYDRCFAYLNQRKVWRKPRLVGWAYAFQQVEEIEAFPWDVRLDAIVTEKAVFMCRL